MTSLKILNKQVLIKRTGERAFVERVNDDKTLLVRIPLPDSPYPKWRNVKLKDLEVPSSADSLPDAPF